MRPHRQQPIRLLCPWDSPGKNTGVSCHFLLQCMKVNSLIFSFDLLSELEVYIKNRLTFFFPHLNFQMYWKLNMSTSELMSLSSHLTQWLTVWPVLISYCCTSFHAVVYATRKVLYLLSPLFHHCVSFLLLSCHVAKVILLPRSCVSRDLVSYEFSVQGLSEFKQGSIQVSGSQGSLLNSQLLAE